MIVKTGGHCMNKVKTIILPNQIKLSIDENNILTCADTDGTHIFLTAGQEGLLKKLAEAPGRPFPCNVLHASYTTELGQLTFTGNPNSSIAKMKNTFPECIRAYIKNIRNLGYYLEYSSSTVDEPVTSVQEDSPITQLCGEYCCFYLDPLGHGTLLNSYLHIKNEGSKSSPQMTGYIISDIRNREILMSDELTALFTSNNCDYKEAFHAYRDTFSNANDKRTSYGEGKVIYENPFANIELNMTHGKWTLTITLAKYLKGNRTKDSEKNCYRGGMGLLMASNSFHGTYCLRIGLIKKDFLKDSFFENYKEIVEMLKIQDSSKDAEWKPLQLCENLDGRWYDFFMRNSPQ